MVRFIIVRHGETTFNRIHRYQGQFDAPLSDLGIRQAEILATRLPKEYAFDAIYASDLSRACDTAAPTARIVGLPINTDQRLREISVGEWEACLVSDMKKIDPEGVAAYRNDPGTFRFPGGEDFHEVYARASVCIEEIARKHDGETVLIVSHGGAIRTLLCVWSGLPISRLREMPDLRNTSVTEVEYDNGTVTINFIGDAAHLDAAGL